MLPLQGVPDNLGTPRLRPQGKRRDHLGTGAHQASKALRAPQPSTCEFRSATAESHPQVLVEFLSLGLLGHSFHRDTRLRVGYAFQEIPARAPFSVASDFISEPGKAHSQCPPSQAAQSRCLKEWHLCVKDTQQPELSTASDHSRNSDGTRTRQGAQCVQH